jgi:hypothetical protein
MSKRSWELAFLLTASATVQGSSALAQCSMQWQQCQYLRQAERKGCDSKCTSGDNQCLNYCYGLVEDHMLNCARMKDCAPRNLKNAFGPRNGVAGDAPLPGEHGTHSGGPSIGWPFPR